MKLDKKRFFKSAVCLLLSFVSLLIIGGDYILLEAKEKETFTVGFDAEFPPYGYKDDNGQYVGFDLDLAQEVCSRNDWNLKKQPIDWDSKDMELKSGMIDCIWNGFTINGREDNYTWSTPYVDNSQVVVVRKDSGIKKLSDLKGKIVVVQADSSALEALTGEEAQKENLELRKSFKKLEQVNDYNSAFMNLDIKAVDAICMDIGVAQYEIASRGEAFVMLEEQISTEKYGVGFYLGNVELRDKVQKTLIQMLEDGTFEEIAKEWGLEECICLSKEDKPKDMSDSRQNVVTKGKKIKKDWKWVKNSTKQLTKAFMDNMIIFFLTLIFSLPLGLLVAFGRMAKFKPLQYLVKFYISVMRGTPLMLQLILVFFGPSILFGWKTPDNYRFYAVIIGFALNYAAYFAEIYRAGIEGVPRGQYEAASVLGYTKIQTFWKIIFPQMCKKVMPPVTNEVITLVKDTTLAFALANIEIFAVANQMVSKQATILPLFIAGGYFYVFNFVVAFVMECIEKKLNYYS
ncbi:polar amino acid transport system substrate-binding protein [[Clostridium] polysaccharolyticum]|uniref:Polar amino acid transport system substrate-binding protein n=1 Tax=[Clostridium] polysaccharolyticum TaxID=29364 RepID=A0A1I0DR04_9FIRM|nr:ABC transporter permease subunit [[Clostridium] polysaccharolyticum]SET34820.1 polar amino acid transport system substrate-binding protein [[Clostridium] polysaccharolyticum]